MDQLCIRPPPLTKLCEEWQNKWFYIFGNYKNLIFTVISDYQSGPQKSKLNGRRFGSLDSRGIDLGQYNFFYWYFSRNFKANDGRNFAAVSTRRQQKKSVTSRHTLGLFQTRWWPATKGFCLQRVPQLPSPNIHTGLIYSTHPHTGIYRQFQRTH